jgi:molybdopterin molybdotransferase
MISFEEALCEILKATCTLERQDVRLAKLLGSYLAAPVVATRDLPSFDNSAVDGFGVLTADLRQASPESPVALKLAGTIQAGDAGGERLTAGAAFKILTGATVPDSVEAVVMREFCEERNGHVLVRKSVQTGENIRRRGAEFQKGQEILPPGLRITPPIIGLLAMLGFSAFSVCKKPRLAVIATGNELVKPGRALQPGQIYDSNTYALVAAANDLGIELCRTFLARDDADSTRNAIKQGLRESDVLITAGGVSVGDYDIVKDVLEECGVRGHFWQIAIKPGKPVYFGTLDSKRGSKRKLVFGLPGNPVSALVTFHQLVRPSLLKMMGASTFTNQTVPGKLTRTLSKKSGRLEFVRAVMSVAGNQAMVSPAAGQDSHMLGGLSLANCLVRFDCDADELAEGAQVVAELLSWND